MSKKVKRLKGFDCYSERMENIITIIVGDNVLLLPENSIKDFIEDVSDNTFHVVAYQTDADSRYEILEKALKKLSPTFTEWHDKERIKAVNNEEDPPSLDMLYDYIFRRLKEW